MFNKRKPETDRIDTAIDELLIQMQQVSAASIQYAKMTDQLAKLYDLRTRTAGTTAVSPDTIATVAANLIGIGMILHHERAHVITTKAIGFVSKLR